MRIINQSFLVTAFERLTRSVYQLRRLIKLQAPSVLALWVLRRKIRNPRTFNQKILYKIANDRSHKLVQFVDKIAVRNYVAETVGSEFLTQIYGMFKGPSDINLSNLPRNFVLKPNHVSGAALVVGDFIGRSNKTIRLSNVILKKYYMNRDEVSEKNLQKLTKFWLDTNYFGYHRTAFPEWAYKSVIPLVYAEELLISNEQLPEDFRFFMFNGECQVIMVDTPGFTGVRRDIYTPEWNLLDVEFGHPRSSIRRERPRELRQMIEVAQLLSVGVDHLRVDLYNLDGRIVFSELTNYHAGGTQKFRPNTFDYELGANWSPKNWY